jgi:hypothetical protein
MDNGGLLLILLIIFPMRRGLVFSPRVNMVTSNHDKGPRGHCSMYYAPTLTLQCSSTSRLGDLRSR